MTSFKPIGLALILGTMAPLAQAFEMKCEGYLNGQMLWSTCADVEADTRAHVVGELGDVEIQVSSTPRGQVELLGYNFIEPSRSYSTASMTQSGDRIELALWKREFLVEVKCLRR